ncbi:MAG: methyltransferase family protein [Bacteroidia bacterium]
MIASAIKRKAFVGLAQLVLILGLIFVLCSGTFRFWQAWVYLLLFGGSSLLITLYLMKKDPGLLQRRLSAGPAGEKAPKQKIIQAFAGLSFLALMAFPGLDQRFGWSQVPFYLSVTGDVFVVAGFYIVFLVFKANTYTSAVIETVENQTVISSGPYAVVRHPMYSGALLMLLFTPLALDSYYTLLFFIPIFITIIFRLLDEEKYLSLNLPGYINYCKKVRYRLIPGFW